MAFSNIDLSRELVQAVRDTIDIVDVASEHTKLEKKGRDHQGVCPLHKEKTPSFHVDADRGLFYCFGCGAGGDAIKLHMLTSGDDFPAAIESLALRYGIPVRERRKRRPDEPDPERALAAAAEYFVEQLGRHDLPQRYLEERKVSPELAETYGIGYAPDSWRALLETLAKRVPQRDLVAAGLVRRSKQGKLYDHFRNRLVFPIHNPSGRLVGFGGRTLGDDRAKYVNTAETERFHKSELLYGLFQARRDIRDGHRAVLVEGYFDVIGAAAAGVVGAVATMGTALTPEQSKLLGRYAEEVVVAYDGDDAGERAHQRALPILLGEGMAVYRARFPDGHDPDSLRLAEGNAAVVKAVGDAGDSVLAEIRRLTPAEARSQPQRQAQAASDLAGLLGGIPDAVLRFSYARRAAESLDLPPELLLRKIPGEQRGGGGGGPGRPGRGGPGRGGPNEPPPPGPPDHGAPPPGMEPAVAPRSEVRSLEESTLEILLSGGELPPPRALPPAEVFHDPQCRNIYRVFCALYGERGADRPPDAKMVLAELGEEGATIDRMARLLVGSEGAAQGTALSDTLDRLTRRWLNERSRALSREIAEAQRDGDEPRLERLLQEKNELSHRLHRGA